MQGTLHIIPANPGVPHRLIRLDRPITQEEIQTAVGGPVEVIPNFDTVVQDGRIQLCYAFCDEEGQAKRRPSNHWASVLWSQALVRRYGYGQANLDDEIVGSVALLTGDTEFMQAL